MKGRAVFAIVGWGMVGLAFLSLLLRAVWQVKTGNEWWYLTYMRQPMTYLGLIATFGVVAIVGLVQLYYWVKGIVQRRREK